MTDDVQDIRDDLAFLRTLVQTGDDNLRQFGRLYFAAGACYLAQTLLGLGQAGGWIKGWPIGLAIGVGPTVIFLVCLALCFGAAGPSRRKAPRRGPSPRCSALLAWPIWC